MKRRRVALSLAAAASAILACAIVTSGDARAEPRAVIELFTSQGCSSCPAADKLAGELARDPSLVVMSLPIDYWDYLGWKDTLAIPGHTKRQKAYSKARGDREVYTPQVVINGVVARARQRQECNRERDHEFAQARRARPSCRAFGFGRSDFRVSPGNQERRGEG